VHLSCTFMLLEKIDVGYMPPIFRDELVTAKSVGTT
jgi:hypothetical protein